MLALIDANIAMYAAGRDHPSKAPSVALLERIARGEVEATSDAEVFQEILHRYGAIGRREDGFRVFDALEKILPSVLPVEMEDVAAARQVMAEHPSLTARDAIHVAVMRRHGVRVLYSYDRHFDEVPGIERREP